MKITNEDFKLREIYALQHLDRLDSGATLPMLIRGVCKETQTKGDYVVKYIAGQRMNEDASCRELLSSFLALELDLFAPEPVLIDIQQDFIDTLDQLEEKNYIQNCIGYNFGSKYIEGYTEIFSHQSLNDFQINEAINIFAFDILISNYDRRINKHNLISNGKDILIFDHELAYGFLFDIFPNENPWIIKEADLVWIKNHVFYNNLVERKPTFEDFTNKLDRIDTSFWNKADRLIPKAWQTSQYDRIKKHLHLFKDNKDVFLQQLNRLVI